MILTNTSPFFRAVLHPNFLRILSGSFGANATAARDFIVFITLK
ncbi:hypothetical protein X875_2580 [Mannheimia varigena USDA-ARS-USMARC-1388]|nr:hypothetical protein X875_2580 [Mannheimia varigena USDA-ARS-USMARC-1388]